MSLHTRILLGLVLGAGCGIAVNLLTPRPPSPGPASVVGALNPALGWPAGIPWPALAPEKAPAPPQPINWLITYLMEPVGQVFLRLLLMTVIPLVFASLALGVAKLGRPEQELGNSAQGPEFRSQGSESSKVGEKQADGLGRLGRIGGRAFAFFLVSMSLSVLIGLLLVNTVRPGDMVPTQTREALVAQYGGEVAKSPPPFGIDTFVRIVPSNPIRSAVDMDMLGVIFFALMFGLGVTWLEASKADTMLRGLEGLGDVMVAIINMAMRLAPYGVFALIFSVTARFGFDLLRPLGMYVLVVVAGLALQMFGVLSFLLVVLARVNPFKFFGRIRAVIVTAFSTSSSNATLPTSLKVAEQELGVPRAICGFVLPLGATMNMNGTALFEGVTVVFLAQVFGKDLTLGQQTMVVALAVLTAIGAAGVPGGSIPLLMMVLAYAEVPAAGIALILGIDRLLDMCRTTLNVVGDVAATAYVARAEGVNVVVQRAPTT